MYVETFGKKLRQARLEAGYTQQQIEDLTKVNQRNLSKYENGRLEPNIETIGKLADFYEVSVDWLFGTKGANRK